MSLNAQPTIDEEKQREARQYARIRRVLLLADLGLTAVIFLGLLFTGTSVALREIALASSTSRWVVVGIYFVVFYLAYTLITLPLSLYGGFVVPHRFGQSNQSLAGWFGDWMKSTALGLVMGALLVEALYLLLAVFPQTWWIPAGIGLVLFTVVLTNLAPVLLVPLFYKLRPLDDQALVARLTGLAERAATKVRGVYAMDMSSKTNAANAALMGIGNTRRIVLGDTLLDKFTPDEIETVMAHELGHHVHADIPKLIAVQSAITFVGLYVTNVVLHWATGALGFESVADIAAFPVLALTLGLFGTVTTPIAGAFSRRVEAEADDYALRLTDKPEAFADAMIRLANQNLAEIHPARWVEVLLYDHPPVGARIAAARRFAAERRKD